MESINGDVRLSVALDTGDVKKDAKQLNSEIEKIFNSGDTGSPKFEKMKLQMKKSYEESSKLQQKLEDIANTQIPTSDYKEIAQQLKSSKIEYDRLIEKQDALTEKGKNHGKNWDNLQNKIEQVGNTIRYAESEMQSLVDEGKAFTLGSDTEAYTQTEQRLDIINDRMRLYISSWQAANRETLNHITLGDKCRTVVERIAHAIKTTLGLLLKLPVKVLSGIYKGATRIGNGFADLTRQVKGLSKPLTHNTKLLKRFVLAGISIRGIASLGRKAASAIKEGFKSMATLFPNVDKDISNLMNSFNALKNSVAATFQPLLAVISPVLTRIIDMLTQAVNKIGQLFAALTGQGFVYKAVKAQTSYADSLKDTAKSADEAKGSLAGFDKLENQTSQKQADSTDSGTSPAFEIAEIESSINNLAQRIKEAWDKADFYDLGYELGQQITAGLESIPWDKIKEISRKLALSLATGLNGLFDGIDWTTLGNTVAQGLNTLATFVFNFSKTLDWKKLGTDIADGIMGFIKGLDAEEIGGAISETLIGLLDAMIAFLEELDWEEIGNKVEELIENIDWFGIWGRLGLLFAEALEAIFIELPALLADVILGILQEIFTSLGMDSVAGFLEGVREYLSEGVGTIREWFDEYVVQPIKDFFGIHSPSTLFAEIGGYLIEGLVEGISSLPEKLQELYEKIKEKLGEVIDWVKTNFGTRIQEAFEDVKLKIHGVFSSLWEGLKQILNNIIGGVESLVNRVVGAINTMITGINSVSGKVGIPAIPMMNTVSLPRLAEGTVIPPNKEFMAILGDQKSGTNIEAPLDTIKQAVREVGPTDNTEELELLREQNSLLRALLDKDWGPSDDQMFKSVRNSARTFSKSNGGKSAFSF